MKEPKTLAIKIELEGYEEVKNKLTDIEKQLDRIISKKGSLNDKTQIVKCPKCGITVIEKLGNREHICLPESKIRIVRGDMFLECNCNNEIVVDAYTLKLKGENYKKYI